MWNAYAALLRLYPPEHQKVFAEEMLQTFEQSAAEQHTRGRFTTCCFAAWEFTGLLRGLIAEWFAKMTAAAEYSDLCSRLQDERACPSDPSAFSSHIQQLIREMESAIAHHDFRRARLYSEKERIARHQLDRFLARTGK